MHHFYKLEVEILVLLTTCTLLSGNIFGRSTLLWAGMNVWFWALFLIFGRILGIAATRDFLAHLVSTSSEDTIELYLDQIIDDTKRVENNEEYALMFKRFYQRFVEKAAVSAEEEETKINEKALNGVISVVRRMSGAEVGRFIAVCESGLKRYALTSLALSGQLVAKSAGQVVGGFFVVAPLAWAVVKNIYQWWRGEISGKRCCKNIIDSSASILGKSVFLTKFKSNGQFWLRSRALPRIRISKKNLIYILEKLNIEKTLKTHWFNHNWNTQSHYKTPGTAFYKISKKACVLKYNLSTTANEALKFVTLSLTSTSLLSNQTFTMNSHFYL